MRGKPTVDFAAKRYRCAKEFNKKLKHICKKHHLKTNKSKDSCFNSFYALFDYCHAKADTHEKSSKEMLEELQNVSIEQEVFTLSRTKDYVITDLRRDRECLSDARRALQKAKYENERRAKAHCKALNSYEKHQNSKDVDKYRVVYADKMALFESSTEEYSLQVDKFNQLQRSSVEHVIPNACRTLQEVYSKNSNTWLELLTNIVKIETNLIEKRSAQLKKLKMTISSVNPNDDQVEVTKQLQKENVDYPRPAEVELPNLKNLKFDEITLGMPTPTISRKLAPSSPRVERDSGHSSIRRSYNRLVEPLPPRSSLREKKLNEFYSSSVGNRQRSISIGGRSLLPEAPEQVPDEADSFGTGSYMYVDRSNTSETQSSRIYEDPYPEKSFATSASNSPALPPRGTPRRSRSPAKIYERIRNKARNKSNPASPKLSNVARSAQSKQYHTERAEYNNPIEKLKPKKSIAPPPPPSADEEKGRPCRAMFSFKAEFERCISVSKNEQLSLFRSLSDGWSLIENEKGQRGFVPTDYLEFSF